MLTILTLFAAHADGPPAKAAVLNASSPVVLGHKTLNGKKVAVACKGNGAGADCRAMTAGKVVGSATKHECTGQTLGFMVEISGVNAGYVTAPRGPGSFAQAVCSGNVTIRTCASGWVKPCPSH